MAVALGLRDRGHDVAFYTGGSFADTVRNQGFCYFPFEAVDNARVESAVRGLVSNNWRPGSWQELMLGTVLDQLRDLYSILPSWQPDALLCDIAMWGPILVLHERQRIPVALLSHVDTCLLPGRDNPLPGLNWLLKGSALRPIAPLIAWLWHRASAAVPRAANSLRQNWGLPPMEGTVTEFTGKMPLYLVPGTPAFDRNRSDLPPSAYYIGPCLWDKDQSQLPPPWIATVKNQCPTVIVSEGMIYPDKPALIQAAARGLANLPLNVVIVAGEGRALETLKLGALPPNVRLERWAPLSDLLPIADLLVAGGDSETVMAALKHNVPMVLAPMILDQPENSWLLNAAGAGISLPRWKLSPQRLASAVNQVLSEPHFRENVARLSADFHKYSGADRAALLLENLATENRGAWARSQRASNG